MGLGAAATAAAIGAAGGIAGGMISSSGAKSAAKTQATAADNAAALQKQASDDALKQQLGIYDQTRSDQFGVYNQTRSDLAPYLSVGTGALSQLSQMLGIGGGAPDNSALYSALANSPGYQFSKQEGLSAVNQSGAARGLLNSGSTIRNATQFGEGLAQSTLGDYLNRIFSLAQNGQNAAVQGGAAGGSIGSAAGAASGIGSTIMNGANGQANSLLASGSATAAGQQGSSLALSGGINSALNNSLLAYQLSQSNGGYSPDYTSGMLGGLNIPQTASPSVYPGGY